MEREALLIDPREGRDGNAQPVRRPAYPSIEELGLYLRELGIIVPEGQVEFLVPCPFGQPPPHLITFNLRAARYACSRCGIGDIYAFEAYRTRIDHLRRSIELVWDIIAATKKQAPQPSAGRTEFAPSASEPSTSELSSLELREARMVVDMVQRRPGRARRVLQQCAHIPAGRFKRIIYWLEQARMVSSRDERSTGGRYRRLYFPGSHAATPRSGP